MAEKREYGFTKDGQEIFEFTLKNKNNVEVRCINLGCRLTHFFAPAPNGEIADILLGYDSLAAYEEDASSHGAFIGRYANRIENAQFTIGDVTYPLTKNDGNNFLHGSFGHRVFDAEIIGENAITFTYTSPNGEDGFPGELWVAVTYSLSDQNELIMNYQAIPSADTYFSFTNHSYFNIAGEGTVSVDEQIVWLNSKSFLEINDGLCPTGRVLDSMGGAFDFYKEKPIGKDIYANDPQLTLAGGYDHAFILEKDPTARLTLAAAAKDPVSGRALRVYTTQPAVHFYTGNFLNDKNGKNSHIYSERSGFCFETEQYPSSPTHPDFPSTFFTKGQKGRFLTVLQVVL